MNSSYFQFQLTEESRAITTFRSLKGLKRFKQGTMGINSVGEEVDGIIRESLSDIPNVANIHDDITIAANRQQHDKALRAVFQRFSDLGLTMNRNKCKFNQQSITFWGMKFSSEGVSPDPGKVDTLQYAV